MPSMLHGVFRISSIISVTILWSITACTEPELPPEVASDDCCATPEEILAQTLGDTLSTEALTATLAAGVIPEELKQEGHKLFVQHGCAVCHGSDGRGDGPMAANLNPEPRDFRNPESYKMGRTVAAIAKTIQLGVLNNTSMPAYPHINAEERIKIGMYLVGLQGTETENK